MTFALSSTAAQAANPTLRSDRTPWKFTTTGRVVAIGDIHGDFTALLTILGEVHLIDPHGEWTGGKAHLVLMGDLNDRGPDTRLIYDFLMSLEQQALGKGGHVHALLGNHECIVAAGDSSYVAIGEGALFENVVPPSLDEMKLRGIGASDEADRIQALKAQTGDTRYARWIRGRNTIVQINDALFVHAGFEDWAVGADFGRVNSTVRAWFRHLQTRSPPPPPKTAWVLSGSGDLHELGGPLWTRRLAWERVRAEVVDKILRKNRARYVVIGHTLERAPIESLYGGKVYRIDTGISRRYKGLLTALEFNGGSQPQDRVFERPAEEHPLQIMSLDRLPRAEALAFPMRGPSAQCALALHPPKLP